MCKIDLSWARWFFGCRGAKVCIVGQILGPLASPIRNVAFEDRLQSPKDPFDQPLFVASISRLAKHLGKLRLQLTDLHSAKRGRFFFDIQRHLFLLCVLSRKSLTDVDTVSTGFARSSRPSAEVSEEISGSWEDGPKQLRRCILRIQVAKIVASSACR
jgi:hypothetical protein